MQMMQMVQMIRKVTTVMVVSSQIYSAIALPARVVKRAKAVERALRANIENMIPGIPSISLHFAHASRCAGLGNASTAAVANEVGEFVDNA